MNLLSKMHDNHTPTIWLFMLFASLWTLNFVTLENNFTNIDYYGPVEETQHTFCKIATEELQATANATITRELKGVCTSKELKKATTAILKELQLLKDAISSQGSDKFTQQYRSKRRNSHRISAKSERPPTTIKPPKAHIDKLAFSYYWTIDNATHNLHDEVSLHSPEIIYEEATYQIRLEISKHIGVFKLVQLFKQRDLDALLAMGAKNITLRNFSYKLFLLHPHAGNRDLHLDSSNNYSTPLRKLRHYQRDTDTLLIKLLIF